MAPPPVPVAAVAGSGSWVPVRTQSQAPSVSNALASRLAIGQPAPDSRRAIAAPAGGATVTADAAAWALASATASLAQGVAVGQVLSDASGLPLPGATVRIVSGQGTVMTTTDERGRYALPASDPLVILRVEKAGMTPVDRTLSAQEGVGSVVVDARLTPVSDPTTITPLGGTLTPSTTSVTIPAGAVSTEAAFTLTALSPEGLPGLLPLGWSPLAAFDLAATAPVAGNLEASFTGLPALTLHLVTYRPALHEWVMVAPGLTPADGAITASVPGLGSYALVVPDTADMSVPAAGQMLAGVEMVPLPQTATATGVVTPATLPPMGGTATGSISVHSPIPLPSGTVVQVQVTETFTLASGSITSGEQRSEDILLFRTPAPAGAALAAAFPITPSRSFALAELREGKVHLDIFAGRESVRGKTGGSDAVTLESGDARLSVAAGALGENTAIAFEQAGTLSSFLPSSGDLLPLAEMVVDFSGKTLSRSAELSVLATGVSAEDTLLVAEVVRAGDVPRVAVVALAQLVSDRVVSVAYPGLPGIVEGGRYVFYRSSPVGFVSGVTSSPAGLVKSLVAMDSLAFVSYSRLDGSYIVAARPGGVGLQARVTGTSLVGAGTATALAAQTASLNISLAGAVTGATVSPEDGSVAVPTSVQVEITTSSPMNASTVSADSVTLFKGPVSEGQAAPVRFVLSASGRTLAVIPQAALEYGTSYTLVASGLADAFGGLVHVPTTTFRTKESTLPVYDVRKLTFSFPDQDGLVTVSAPAGTFPPGTTILIINSGNGVVLSLTAENDGAVGHLVPATLPATLDDQMLVTITDPLGHVTTFTRSQFFDAATGKTAVGPGGGVVEAADGSGVELRIPEGALQGGTRFKITPFRLEDLPEEERQTPDFPQAALGGGLKLESEDKPELKKEAKLAFPLPSGLPANPKDAFFYVYRKLQGPEGKVYFQTIDQAFVECPQGSPACTPEQMRVVTASFPFLGVVDAIGSFAAGVVSFATNYYFLMWTYDQTRPGKALSGTITGRVLRQKWENTAEYEPLRKVTVLGVAADSTMAALTDDTGRFTLFDPHYAGGTVEVRATVDGVTKTATAYEANPNDWTSTLLRHHRNVATADIVFPAVPPAQPPASIQIVVVREADRAPIAGFAQVGTPLLIGFKTETTTTISDGASIQGATLPVQGPLTDDPSGFNYVGSFTASQAGTHTVTVTGVAASGQAITASSSFLAVAAGGSNNEPLPNEAPRVLTDLTVPQSGARDVQVTVFPQVVFSEPVRGLKTGVTLISLDGSGNPVKAVAVSLLGITPAGQAVEITDDSAMVTSLTIRPTAGLAYATPYKLSLKVTITDLDAPPKALEAYEASFRTFGPKSVGGSSDRALSPGIALLGDRAYLVENLFYGGTLKAYDVSNPVEVKELESARKPIVNHPMDVTGELDGPLARRIVAVATASTNTARPSNLHLFDTSDDGATQWIGAVSLTPSAVAGSVRRIAVKGSFAYAITFRKGIQAVDLDLARSLFVPCGTGSTCSLAHWEMLEALSKDGQGFGGAAVVRTTPVRNPQASRDAYLWDLEVRDFVTDPSAGPKPLVVATGDVPLVVVDPQAGQVLSQGGIEKTDASGKTSKLSYGHALGLGYAGLRTLGVVAGLGTVAGASAKTMVAVVGLDDPRRPQALGFLDLSDHTCLAQSAGAMLADVLVKDDQALIGGESCVAVVSLADPTRPMFAGTISGVGGGLALGTGANEGLLFSTWRSVFGGSNELGGVRSAALGTVVLVKHVGLAPVVVQDGKSVITRNVPIDFTAIGAADVTDGRIEITKNGNLLETLTATMSGSGGSAVWPAGREVKQSDRLAAQPVVQTANGELCGFAHQIVPTVVDLDVDSTNTKDKADPARTDAADDREDTTGDVRRPGKIVFTNDGDLDGDGVPDFADGTEVFRKAKDQVSAPLTPMILELPAGIDLSVATLRFTYSGSDPAAVQKNGTQSAGYTYTPAPGALRVWTKDGAKARNSASVASGGDYVSPGVPLTVSALGTPVTPRTYRLFVEGVDYSRDVADGLVKVEVSFKDTDGSSVTVSDEVRTTVLEQRLVQPDAANHVTPAKGLSFSHPSPVVTVSDARVTNIRLSDDGTRILGDVVLAGRVACAVCDYTPGELGKIDSVRVFVNDTTSPIASLAVDGPKALEARSLLKPFAFDGGFSGTVAGVELQRGANLIRVDTADKVYQITGYGQLSIEVKGTEPPVVVVDYRVALDFGGATSLAALKPDTPVHLILVDKARTPEGRFEGDIFKTSDAPLVFSSAEATVTIQDPLELEAALAPDAVGTIDAGILAPSFVPAFLAYNLKETTASSNAFVRSLVHVEVTPGPLSDSAPDTIQALIDDGQGQSAPQALLETGDDTRTFVSADGGFAVRIPAEQPLIDVGWRRISVSDAAFGLSDFALDVKETAPGSGTFRTDDTTDVGPDDLATLAGWQFEPGEATPLEASTGGQFQPYMIQILGPDALLAQIFSAETADGPRDVRRAFDGNYYIFMKHSPPAVYLMLPAPAGLMIDPQASQANAEEMAAFLKGYVKGFLAGGFSMVEGTFELGKIAIVESVRTMHPLGMAYVMTFGDRYKGERQFARSAADLAVQLAALQQRIQSDEADLAIALAAGDEQSVAAISGPYALAYEYGIEFLEALGQKLADSPPEDQGYILGRAVFEIAALAAPFAKAGEAGEISKLAFLERVKAAPVFQDVRLAGAFERIAGFMEDLRVTKMCFVAGTEVHTDRGLRRIEDVRPGDRVLSRDRHTSAQAYKAVVATVVTHPTRLYHVRYRARERCTRGERRAEGSAGASGDDEGDEAGGAAEIVSTGAHPFFVVGRGGFVPADELRVGDLFALADGGRAEVVELRAEDIRGSGTFSTYNLEVEGFHTYFVGREGVWVHNAGRAFCERLKSLFELALKQKGNDVWAPHARLIDRFDALLGVDTSLGQKGVARLEMYTEARRRYFTDLASTAKTPPPWRTLAGQTFNRTNPPFGTDAMAQELNANMEAVLGVGKPDRFAGHHMVPPKWRQDGGLYSDRLRKLLANNGVHLNERNRQRPPYPPFPRNSRGVSGTGSSPQQVAYEEDDGTVMAAPQRGRESGQGAPP